jgi:hypothetical protein
MEKIKKIARILGIAFAMGIFIVSCDRQDLTPDQKIAALQFQLNQTQANLASLSNSVNSCFSLMTFNRPWADIDFTKPGFQVIDTTMGPLQIAASNAVPYLDGYRLTIEICNPLSVRFGHFKLRINTHSVAGIYNGSFMTNWEAYNASGKIVELDRTENLTSGYWTLITFDIAPMTSVELHSLRVGVILNEIQAGTL